MSETPLLSEGGLRAAVDRGELTLAFQPLVRSDGIAVGCEALLRWRDVPAERLLPALEALDLMGRAGQWALFESCRQLRRWHRAGHDDLVVHVNVSTQQFLGPDFVAGVVASLAAHHLPASALQLEVAEDLLLDRAAPAAQRATLLRDFGVGLWIDGFGAGYSSLRYLKAMPVHGIKLGRECICGLPGSRCDLTMISVLGQLAQQLRLSLIAQGVETAGQLECLRAVGLHRFQGFLFAPPLAPEAFEQQVLERRRLAARRRPPGAVECEPSAAGIAAHLPTEPHAQAAAG